MTWKYIIISIVICAVLCRTLSKWHWENYVFLFAGTAAVLGMLVLGWILSAFGVNEGRNKHYTKEEAEAYLKEAFPQATFVGFTGTPIAETYQTFGDEIDRYTMDQAVADGLTVSIKYHPRIAKVLLNKEKVKQIDGKIAEKMGFDKVYAVSRTNIY